MSAKRSFVWHYFNTCDDKDKVKCNAGNCKAVISSKSGNTSGMINHLKSKHPLKYFEFKNESGYGKREASVGHQEEIEVLSEDGMIPNQVIGTDGPSSSVSNRLSTKQLSLESFKKVDKKTADKYSHAIAYWLAVDMEPYMAVEKPGFKHLMSVLAPNYEVPGRKCFAESKIPQLYTSVKEIIREELSKCEAISLTADCWTSPSQHPYLSITAHFIDQSWNLKSYCLECCSLNIEHTANNLKEAMLFTLGSWGIDIEKVCCVTTDNGSNIVKAISLAGLIQLSCFGHTLNIGASKAMKLFPLKFLFDRLNKIRSVISFSTSLRRELKKKQVELGMHERILPSTTPTRWWSCIPQLEAYKEQKDAINHVLSQTKHVDLILNHKYSCLVEMLLSILSPLKDMSEAMSAEKYVTASGIWPLYQQLKEDMRKIDDSQTQFSVENMTQDMDAERRVENDTEANEEFPVFTEAYEENDELYLQQALAEVEEEITKKIIIPLKQRYEEIKTKNLILKCCLLDPRFKDLYLGMCDLSVIRGEIQKELNMVTIQNAEKHAPVQKKRKLGFAAFLKKKSTEMEEDNEVTKYLCMNKVNAEENPLEWWLVHEKQLPRLAKLARKYLCIPATSVPSERVFSMGGNVVSDHRMSLSPEHVNQLVFLSSNKNVVPKYP